jgi:multidrug efflux pump subunit AcrA (membrane-fusion protein)
MNKGWKGDLMKYSRFFSILLATALVCSGCSGSFLPGLSSASVPEVQANVVEPVKAESGILTEASVVPRQSVSLGFGIAGIVEEVLKEGTVVKEGDVVARLKNSAKMASEVSAANLDLLTAKKALKDLSDNHAVALAEANLRLANADKGLDKAQKDRQSMAYRVATDDTLSVLRADLLIAEENVKRAQESCGDCESSSDYNVNMAGLMTQLAAARKTRDRAKANLNYGLSIPDQFEVQIAEAKLQVAQAEWDAAKRGVDLLASGPDPDELVLAKARVDNAQASLDAAKVELADLEIRSPIEGIVTNSDIQVGEMVDPAMDKIIIADTTIWQVETTNLTELEVVQIQVGSPVEVKVDALPNLTLTGKVLHIRPEGQNKQGDILYTAVIGLEKQDSRLLWNMTASARINPGITP